MFSMLKKMHFKVQCSEIAKKKVREEKSGSVNVLEFFKQWEKSQLFCSEKAFALRV